MAAGKSSAVAWLLAAAVAAALVASASAQSGSGSGSGCTTTLISLYPCLNYISGNVSRPPPSCCTQLASVVQTNPQCLCAALNSDASTLGGVTIDKTRALQLPQACSVKTPPASKCNSAGGGGSAPGGAATTPATPSSYGVPAATAGTGTGSKTTPTAPFIRSGGVSVRAAVSLVLAFAAVTVYAISAV